jgi:FtsH-binding integral membrane protein
MTKKSLPKTQDATSKLETVFAYMAVGLIGTSVLVMLATLIIAATGTATPSVGKVVVPPIMIFYPQFGLAAGALAIIALLIASIKRRSKANRNN